MKNIYARCTAIVKAQSANYPYLDVSTLCKIVGMVMRNRRKQKQVISDIQIAVRRCEDVPFQHQRGYRKAASLYFNQHGTIVGSGSTYTLYKNSKTTT